MILSPVLYLGRKRGLGIGVLTGTTGMFGASEASGNGRYTSNGAILFTSA
jgi:hypothetical protein